MMEEIIPTSDRDIGSTLRKCLSKKGINFLTQTELSNIEIKENMVETTVKKNDGSTEILQSEKVCLPWAENLKQKIQGWKPLILNIMEDT